MLTFNFKKSGKGVKPCCHRGLAVTGVLITEGGGDVNNAKKGNCGLGIRASFINYLKKNILICRDLLTLI